MIESGRVQLSQTPALIVPDHTDQGGCTVYINNNSEGSIYIDGPNVNAQNGFELSKKQIITIHCACNEPIYGMVANGTAEICYLVTHR